MTLSVLIPSIPTRYAQACELHAKISAQAVGLPAEVLLLVDNKQRSIGLKREALLWIARGKYVAYVDDDDTVHDNYLGWVLEAAERDPDVIVFDSWCEINGSPSVRVRHGLEFENEQYNPAGFTRKPWHIHPWRRNLVTGYHFPDISNGEDWGWCSQFVDLAKRQCRVPGPPPLYRYRYNRDTSEAA